MTLVNRRVLGALAIGVGRDPSSDVGLPTGFAAHGADEVGGSDFDDVLAAALRLGLVPELVDVLHKVFDDGDAAVFEISTKSLQRFIGQNQRAGQVAWHDERTRRDVDVGMHVSFDDFLVVVGPLRGELEVAFVLVRDVVFEELLVHRKVAVGAFERGWLAAAVHGLPGLGGNLVSKLRDAIKVHQGTVVGLGAEDTVVNLIIDHIRRGVPAASAGRVLAHHHERTRFDESCMSVFVDEHRLHFGQALQLLEEHFARRVDANIRARIVDCRGSSDLNGQDAVVGKALHDGSEDAGIVVQVLADCTCNFGFDGIHDHHVELICRCLLCGVCSVSVDEPLLGILFDDGDNVIVEANARSTFKVGAV
mmetsp:Transcript_22690/g.64244  ORF Transcript_22690/g.64244 Transcript_22690/m.64244 type:complete len:364 (+) Transcript_22690:237-1328(+)